MINCVHIVRAIGRSGSYVLGSIVFAITLVAAHGQAVPAIDHNSGGTERINRATVLKMHQNLVSSVANGTNPDDRLSQTLAKDYPDKLTTKTVHTESVESYGRKVPLSYMEAIARTEELLKESGLRVTVEIQASPRSCNIRYQPVIGGPVLDAGTTNLSRKLDPKWYVFSCDCKTPPLQERVDCTEDQKISFSCR